MIQNIRFPKIDPYIIFCEKNKSHLYDVTGITEKLNLTCLKWLNMGCLCFFVASVGKKAYKLETIRKSINLRNVISSDKGELNVQKFFIYQ